MKNHRTKHLNTAIACTPAGCCRILKGILQEEIVPHSYM